MATEQLNPAAIPVRDSSFRSQWASIALRDSVWNFQKRTGALPDPGEQELLPVKESQYSEVVNGTPEEKTFRVGIVGAGVAGLFTAMIFDHLCEEYKDEGLKIEYEILEANCDKRHGGRLYTYKFPPKDGQPSIGVHDYYDVGAMRFPNIHIMKRTFQLFCELKMEFNDQDDLENRVKNPPKIGQLIPYHLKGNNTPSRYNDISTLKKHPTAQDFRITGLPVDIMDKDPGDMISKQIKCFTDVYEKCGAGDFWDHLMKEGDKYSVRQYLAQSDYDYNTIEFLETMNYGNRWYDQAFSEMVLENMDFDHDGRWWCVEGGSQQIAYRMRDHLKNQKAIEYQKRVLAMSYAGGKTDQIDVTIRGEGKPRRYDAVFNSAPLGAMQQMNLEGLNLNWGTKQAIRSLGYGASCKIGVRFADLWWIKKLGIDDGGQAKTDLPIRCCVYPSYNMHDRDGKKPDEKVPGVLLVSYTWSQEAERIGALISRESPKKEDELREVVLHDLARLHSSTEKEYQDLVQTISSEYLDHFAYNWYSDPTSVGAFAYFGPGQFKNMYPEITKCNGKHVIIGEAASSHHAWMVGALESAVRGVYQFLWKHSKVSHAAHCVAKDYANDKIKAPYGPVPAEYDRTQDIQTPENFKDDVGTGELARAQVLMEDIRLKQGGDVIQPDLVTEKDVKPILSLVAAQA